jgi:eukaryotic-like serine/threonine-protein kinase
MVVLTMRADFLHRAADDPALARAIGEHDLIVSPMTLAELRDAIVRPAELAGGDFEPGLVDELVEQGQQGALPLLEYTLAELWKERQPNGTMIWDVYRRLGGIEGVLAARADAILAERYTAEQRDELRQVLLRWCSPAKVQPILAGVCASISLYQLASRLRHSTHS